MEIGDIVKPSKMWGSNNININKAKILEIYTDYYLTEYKIKDLDNNIELIVYDYEVE